MNIIQRYIPVGTKRRSGQKILSVLGIVSHDTGNDGTTAAQNVNYFINSANEIEASAHTFVDDKEIIECIPINEKAWHVRRNMTVDNNMFGVDANDYFLGIELCYFSKDLERSKLAYNNFVEYHKKLCQIYKIDPTKRIVGHYTLDPDRRTDPVNAFSRIGKTWADFIKDVSTPAIAPIAGKDVILSKVADALKLVEEVKVLLINLK